MPEAQAGVRRSPCAAVTNTTLPLLPPLSLLSYLPLSLKREGARVSSGEGTCQNWMCGPWNPGSCHLDCTLSSQAKVLPWAKTQESGCPAQGCVGGKCESWKSGSRSGERSSRMVKTDLFPWALVWTSPSWLSLVSAPEPLSHTPHLGV